MKIVRILAILLGGAVIGMMLTWYHLSHEYWEEKRWNVAVELLRDYRTWEKPDSLRSAPSPNGLRMCLDDATELLRLNQVSGDIPNIAGAKGLWDGRTAAIAVSKTADGQYHAFACLLGRDMKRERTTYLFPTPTTKDAWVELGEARMLDAEF